MTSWGKESRDRILLLASVAYVHTVLGSSLGTVSPVFWDDSYQNIAHGLPVQNPLGRLNSFSLSESEMSLGIYILRKIPDFFSNVS